MDSLIWYPGHALLIDTIVHAEGPWVVAQDGRRWLDLESGVWAASIGQSHPRVATALQEQFAAIAHAGFNYTAPVVREAIAAALAKLDLGEGARATLLCSGSEAVEYCIRVARPAMPRPRFLTMADSYFGAYGAAHGRPADDWATFDWFGCAGCPDERTCDASCERFATIPLAEIGAFVFEPGSSSGFVRFPPAKLVAAIAAAVQGAGGFLLVNEVTTGVGRTGHWFGWQHYAIRPDAVALGKGLGGGYPVACAAVGPRVAAVMGVAPPYAQSHQNDPLGAAVLLAVLGTIDDDGLIALGEALGALLKARLAPLICEAGGVREVRGRGPMVAIDLDRDAAATTAVHRALFDAGYLVGLRPGTSTLRLDPPLNLDPALAEGFCEAFAEALAATL